MIFGTLGILSLLGFSVYRLAIIAYDIVYYPMQWWHWVVCAVWVAFMAYSEGYKGFQMMFAPRVSARLYWLAKQQNIGLALLAPLFGMGLIYASRKRLITSYAILVMVVIFVLFASSLPAPWRAIMDAGVVVGLAWGMVSTLAYVVKILLNKGSAVDPELPSLP